MLMLEGGAIREFVGNSMLVEVVNMLFNSRIGYKWCNKLVLGISLIFCITLNVKELSLQVVIGWDEMLRDDLCKGIYTMELEDEDEVVDDDGQANNDGEV